MMRMLIVGYCFGIRSERRLCDEVHLNLAYRWFCRLGLDGDVPDHSTFSKNRHGRFRESDLLRKLFETVVARCIKERIVGGEAFGVDASMIVADASRRRAVAKVEDLDPTSSRAVAEYLTVLDDAAFGAATPVEPKSISPTDPAARYTAAADTPAYAYADNYLVDLKNAVIMDVEATTVVRQAEVGAAKTMIDRTAERFDVTPSRLVEDAGYGSGEMVAWLVDERGIEPHVKLVDKSERTDGTFSRSAFIFDTEANVYVCPGGKELKKYHRNFSKPRGEGLTKDGTLRYFARKHDCDACALKPKCCPNVPARKIGRSIHEAARDKARAIAKTEAYVASRRERKKVEMLFAHLKRILGLGKLRLRGPSGAKDEFLWRPPPKICGNWRSSSPSRRRSSPHEAERPGFASFTNHAAGHCPQLE
jgi:hypothetical protein